MEAKEAEGQTYRVNGIIDRRRQIWSRGMPRKAARRPFEYLVSWEGYDPSWQLAVELNNDVLVAAADMNFSARAKRGRKRRHTQAALEDSRSQDHDQE